MSVFTKQDQYRLLLLAEEVEPYMQSSIIYALFALEARGVPAEEDQ